MSRQLSPRLASTIRLSTVLAIACPGDSSHASLKLSSDRGSSWSVLSRSGRAATTQIVGPGPNASGRAWATFGHDERLDGPFLKRSDDDGTTWVDVAPPDFPYVMELAFGIDGQTIFAATEDGVWRATVPN